PQAVGSDGRIQAVDAAAAVRLAVHENLDHVVRRERGGVAKRSVVEGQDVTLRPEGIVGGANRRPPMLAGGGPGDPGLGGGWTQAPDVEVGPVFLEGRSGKQDVDE